MVPTIQVVVGPRTLTGEVVPLEECHRSLYPVGGHVVCDGAAASIGRDVVQDGNPLVFHLQCQKKCYNCTLTIK